jgi:hypothetical protein
VLLVLSSSQGLLFRFSPWQLIIQQFFQLDLQSSFCIRWLSLRQPPQLTFSLQLPWLQQFVSQA